MFRLSDYDFEYGEKDYVAFMAVFKKFLDLCHEVNEPMLGDFTEAQMIDCAEDYALEYVDMRQTKKVSSNVADFAKICSDFLGYPDVNIETVEDLDDMLWNVYEDLC